MGVELSGLLTDSNIKALDQIANDSANKALLKNQELGQDAFLRLMMTQLANQDPLSPLDNTEMISQMAEFSSVEQLGAISSSMKAENQTSQDILSVLMTMLESNSANVPTNDKIDELIVKTDRTNELNTNILNELIKLNKAMEAYDG